MVVGDYSEVSGAAWLDRAVLSGDIVFNPRTGAARHVFNVAVQEVSGFALGRQRVDLVEVAA